MRGQLGERFRELEVVGELRAVVLLAGPHGGGHLAARPHRLPELADEVRILGEAFDEDGARTIELLGGVPGRIGGGVADERVGDGLVTGLAGDLRLGAPLRLERQVDVLEPRLGVGEHDLAAQRVVELALRLDRFEDRDAALVEFAQVAETFLESAQLGVVETAGRLLTVTRDERHGRAAVEQSHGRGHLVFADVEFLGDPPVHGVEFGRHVERPYSCRPRHAPVPA